MQIALVTDIHYGVKGDHTAFLDNNKKFFDETFFPYLKDHNINTVVCLGDLMDRRKYVNYNTAYRMRKDFIVPLNENGIEFHWILGNHDIYYPVKLYTILVKWNNEIFPHSISSIVID